MSMREIKTLAELIIKTHDGQVLFNLGEVSKMLGCGANTVPALLHDFGIPITRIGLSKKVNAYDIADMIYSKRIAAIDNTTKKLFA